MIRDKKEMYDLIIKHYSKPFEFDGWHYMFDKEYNMCAMTTSHNASKYIMVELVNRLNGIFNYKFNLNRYKFDYNEQSFSIYVKILKDGGIINFEKIDVAILRGWDRLSKFDNPKEIQDGFAEYCCELLNKDYGVELQG